MEGDRSRTIALGSKMVFPYMKQHVILTSIYIRNKINMYVVRVISSVSHHESTKSTCGELLNVSSG